MVSARPDGMTRQEHQELFTALQDTWISNHPDVIAARVAVENAQRAAKNVAWVDSPALFVSNVRDANLAMGLADAALNRAVLAAGKTYVEAF